MGEVVVGEMNIGREAGGCLELWGASIYFGVLDVAVLVNTFVHPLATCVVYCSSPYFLSLDCWLSAETHHLA